MTKEHSYAATKGDGVDGMKFKNYRMYILSYCLTVTPSRGWKKIRFIFCRVYTEIGRTKPVSFTPNNGFLTFKFRVLHLCVCINCTVQGNNGRRLAAITTVKRNPLVFLVSLLQFTHLICDNDETKSLLSHFVTDPLTSWRMNAQLMASFCSGPVWT